MTNLVVLVPVLRRPHRVAPLMESVDNATDDYRLLFVASDYDLPMIEALQREGAEHFTIGDGEHGQYARKINAGYLATTEPLMFLGADDLHFHPGWLEAAEAALAPGIGVVGTNDLGNPRVMAGKHATHFLVTRAYVDQHGTIDEPGKVLHEGYVHEYVDDELIGTARKRHAWAFAADSHVEHLHPNWGKAPTDELYEAEGRRLSASRRLHNRRRRLWT